MFYRRLRYRFNGWFRSRRLGFSTLNSVDTGNKFRYVKLLKIFRSIVQYLPYILHHGFQEIASAQDNVDYGRIHLPDTISHIVEQILGSMGKFINRLQVQKTGHTLNGMKRTENIIDDIRIIRMLLQIKDIDLDYLKMLKRLFNESVDQIGILSKISHYRLFRRCRSNALANRFFRLQNLLCRFPAGLVFILTCQIIFLDLMADCIHIIAELSQYLIIRLAL